MDSADTLGQRRLAGAIVADKGHDLAGGRSESTSNSARTAPKLFENFVQFQDRGVGHDLQLLLVALSESGGRPGEDAPGILY